MYKILKKECLADDTILMEVLASRIASSALPGQFLIVKTYEKSERIPLTICDYDAQRGGVVLVFKVVGKSTREMAALNVGDGFLDVAGPLGRPSEWISLSDEQLQARRFVFVGGGVGIAPIYPQVKYLHQHGCHVDVIVGAKTKSLLILEKELEPICRLLVTTDDHSTPLKGMVTDILRQEIENGNKYDEVIAIGPMVMMKYVTHLAQDYNIPCTVSLNSIMVDGTGMCGACRVKVDGNTRFTCVDGPEFDGYKVDFELAMKRQRMYDTVEGRKQLQEEEKDHVCFVGGVTEETLEHKQRIPVREQPAEVRRHNFAEVCLGYNAEEAVFEARRCLQCKKPQCVSACPVNIAIPAFVHCVAEGNFEEAARIINRDSALPAVCGRVCPQETQCEGSCVLLKKQQPIAIGKLERFVGDWSRENALEFAQVAEQKPYKVAVIGSGPAGLTCAKELRAKGYQVTIFEALHALGGVLAYGIPSFRLPKETVVNYEVDNLRRMGVNFERNVVVGRTVSVDELMQKEGYHAVFIGTGAGLPNFMGIPGENLCGVVSANEFLTRNNLLFAYKDGFDTPNYVGRKVVVVGGGNVAMDAARTALRLGAEVTIVYRRSEAELPARVEEVHHAREEGVQFSLLCNPVEILADDNDWIRSVRCVRMELGEADASGRRRPVEVKGSEFEIEADMLIMSIGTSPNPLIRTTTPGLAVNRKECIEADGESGQTSREGVFAGGDAVSGAATVILAMGAGKKAAAAIDTYITEKYAK